MEIEEGDEEELLLLEREMKLNLMAEYPDEFCLDFPFDIPDPHAPKRKDKSQQKPKKSTEGTKSVLKKSEVTDYVSHRRSYQRRAPKLLLHHIACGKGSNFVRRPHPSFQPHLFHVRIQVPENEQQKRV